MNTPASRQTSNVDASKLLQIIRQSGISPLDVWHVAALLEMNGITDADAQQDFSYPNIFSLAGAVYTKLPKTSTEETTSSEISLNPFRVYMKHFLMYVPIAIQLILLFGASFITTFNSLAAFSSLNIQVMATTIGFIIAGGPLIALNQLYSKLSSKFWLMCSSVAFFCCLLLLLPLESDFVYSIFALYGFAIVLNVIAHGLHQNLGSPYVAIGGAIIGGSISLLLIVINISVITAQTAGLLISALIMYLWAYISWSRLQLPMSGSTNSIIRAYFYGTLYFTFLAVIRLIIYLDISNQNTDFSAQSYEAALIIAYIPLFFCLLLVETLVEIQADIAVAVKQKFRVNEIRAYVHHQTMLYWRNTLLLLSTMVLLNGLTYFILTILEVDTSIVALFAWTAFGGVGLLWGLLNLNYTPSRVLNWKAIMIMVTILVLHVGISSVFFPEIIGFTISAFLFALITSIWRISLLQRMDYSMYLSTFPIQ